MNIFEGLNREQQQAVASVDGAVLVLAGAGSGKTQTLTRRIAHMVMDKNISPYSILAVTFTNKAAKQMKHRIASIIGDQANNMQNSTFHSFGVRLLRTYIDVKFFKKL